MIVVDGETPPLLGSENLLQGDIAALVGERLIRRGYTVTDHEPDLVAVVTYRTQAKDIGVSTTWASSQGWATALSVATAREMPGIAAASTVARIASGSATAATTVTVEGGAAGHTVAIDVSAEGEPVWKGEATWASSELDLRYELVFALQSVLAALPQADGVYPLVDAVREDKVIPRVRTKCGAGADGMWASARFSAPAPPLPDCLPLFVQGGQGRASDRCLLRSHNVR